MLSVLAGLIAKIGIGIAQTCEFGCMILFIVDEPECPKSLIK